MAEAMRAAEGRGWGKEERPGKNIYRVSIGVNCGPHLAHMHVKVSKCDGRKQGASLHPSPLGTRRGGAFRVLVMTHGPLYQEATAPV